MPNLSQKSIVSNLQILVAAEEQHQHGEAADQGSQRGSVGRTEVVRDKDETGVQAQEGALEERDGQGGHAQEAEGGGADAAQGDFQRTGMTRHQT